MDVETKLKFSEACHGEPITTLIRCEDFFRCLLSRCNLNCGCCIRGVLLALSFWRRQGNLHPDDIFLSHFFLILDYLYTFSIVIKGEKD